MVETKYYNAEVFNYWGSRNPFLKLMANVNQSANSAATKGQQYGRPERLEVDIDAEYLEWLFNEQEGCCPYYEQLGIRKKLNLNLLYETYNFLTPSVDRIDSNLGYIKGNVVITFRGVNHMKQNIPFENFMIQLEMFESGVIKTKSKNIINKLSNPKSNQMDYLELLKVFVDAGELPYAMKVLNQSKGEVSKPITTTIDTSGLPENERLRVRAAARNEHLQPFDASKNLQPASLVHGVSKGASLLNRGDEYWNDMIQTGSLYMNEKGNKTEFLVNVDTVPEKWINKNATIAA